MKLELTKEGKDLLVRSLEPIGGVSVVFSSIKLGNGENAMIEGNESNWLATLSISHEPSATDDDGFVKLVATLNNSNIDSGFRVKEMGVMCVDPDDADSQILFAYAYVDEDKATVIPAISDCAFEIELTCDVYVGDVEDVSAIVQESVRTVSREDFELHANSHENPHVVTKTQVGLGNVPNLAPNDMTIDFTEQSGTVTPEEIHTGSRLSVLFASVAKAVKSLISHLSSRNNPHAVTAQQVGASPSNHKHSAVDVTSGILTVARGGTGVSTIGNLAELLKVELNKATFGSYAGDGTQKRLINIGFTPKAVLLMNARGMTVEYGDTNGGAISYDYFGGLAVGSHSVSKGTNYTDWTNDTVLMITEHGFYVACNENALSNSTNNEYRFIAWM